MQIPYKSEGSVKSDRTLTASVRINGVEPDITKRITKAVKNNGG